MTITVAKAKELYLSGLSMSQIARMHEISISTVKARLVIGRVELRGYGGYHNNARAQAIIDYYNETGSMRGVSARTGATFETVKRVLLRAGVVLNLNNGGRVPIRVSKDVIDRYKAGASFAELNDAFGICRQTIKKALIEAGVAIRKNHGTKIIKSNKRKSNNV